MPFKEKLKTPSSSPRKKAQYKVINWTQYNQSLQKRGEISLYFPQGDLRTQFINESPYVEGIAGQQATYKPAYIELMFMLYRLFGWGLRQITGYFKDLWRTRGLDILVPSFGHLSDLFCSLPLKVRHFCQTLAKRLGQGERLSLIFDSTGLRFGKASHWYETKYDKPCDQKPWRKMHLSIDPDMNVHEVGITQADHSDHDMMDDLIPPEVADLVNKIIADGGYYSKDRVEDLYLQGIIPVIPPPPQARVQGKNRTSWHDQIVQYIQDKGTIYAFYEKYGYNIRALVEAQISRMKRCLGSRLLTQRIESQKREGLIIGSLLNKWNSFGKCVSVKVG